MNIQHARNPVRMVEDAKDVVLGALLADRKSVV